MIWFITAEIALTALASFAFVVLYFTRSNWRASAIGRHLLAFSFITGIECITLIFLGFGVEIPLWIYALVFAALGLVAFQRLWLLVKVQSGSEP